MGGLQIEPVNHAIQKIGGLQKLKVEIECTIPGHSGWRKVLWLDWLLLGLKLMDARCWWEWIIKILLWAIRSKAEVMTIHHPHQRILHFFWGGIQAIPRHTSWKLAFRSSKEATYVVNYQLYRVPPQWYSTNVFERNMVVHKDGFTKGSKCGCPTLPVSLSPTTKLLHILGIAIYLVHVSHAYFSNSFWWHIIPASKSWKTNMPVAWSPRTFNQQTSCK